MFIRVEAFAMIKDFTLSDLQARMDLLASGGQVQISHDDIRRLFCSNDVAPERLHWFAEGHNCLIIRTNQGIIFRWTPSRLPKSRPMAEFT